MSKNILIICGGGGTEHDISLVSARYIESILKSDSDLNLFLVEIKKDGSRVLINEKKYCELRKGGLLVIEEEAPIFLNYAIPVIHGPPGETGDIQSLFEMMELPYYGSGPEASILCFNKISTKLWLEKADIPVTPYLFIANNTEATKQQVKSFFEKNNSDVFIKASNQGSSVGCYHITELSQLDKSVDEAFKYSPYVLIEKTIKGRELEVAVFQHQDKIHGTWPGEIACPSGFYTYEEKYNSKSQTLTHVKADTSEETAQLITSYAIKAFELLHLKDLARIDFFLTDNEEVFLNEINTFPGHTPISMFPMMLENYGFKYYDFIIEKINTQARSR